MALGRHSDFNRLWFGQTVSNFGDKISLLALPTLAVVVLDGGALEVGVLGALRFLPFLLLAPFAGLVADRVSRRTVMIVADLGRFLALGTIPLAFALDSVSMTHVYIVAALTGVLTTFFEVSYQSWLPSSSAPRTSSKAIRNSRSAEASRKRSGPAPVARSSRSSAPPAPSPPTRSPSSSRCSPSSSSATGTCASGPRSGRPPPRRR